jgi:hypothetical protein
MRKLLNSFRIAPAAALALLQVTSGAPGSSQGLLGNAAPETPSTWTLRPFAHSELEAHANLGGAGSNVETPSSRSFDRHTGVGFFNFNYATAFSDQGRINPNLQLRPEHGSPNWFRFQGRVSPPPRSQHGLTYASLIVVFSLGVGYAFF